MFGHRIRFSRLLLAGCVLAGSSWACGPGSNNPNLVEECDGCVRDGECLAGDSRDACGVGADACVACPDGEGCIQGECRAASECEMTCEGCCSGPTCLGGDSSTACGLQGVACVDCGDERVCVEGECVVDPDSRWDVVVTEASLSEKNLDDEAWDPLGGLPDPYPLARAGADGSIRDDIEEKVDTLSPMFSAPVLTRVRAEDLQAGLTLMIFDKDDFNDDDLITGCAVDTTDPEQFFSGMTITLECPPTTIDGLNTTTGTILFHVEPG